ncbi:hypothetical protein HZ326_28881 [Fusarium oxysporum f. sp. albedinis]|nr:hypothetical protein HZ326_28881 [Fusarium oxysporum f. sp. albedinis]
MPRRLSDRVLREPEPIANNGWISALGSLAVRLRKTRVLRSLCLLTKFIAQRLPTGDSSRSASNPLAISSTPSNRREILANIGQE